MSKQASWKIRFNPGTRTTLITFVVLIIRYVLERWRIFCRDSPLQYLPTKSSFESWQPGKRWWLLTQNDSLTALPGRIEKARVNSNWSARNKQNKKTKKKLNQPNQNNAKRKEKTCWSCRRTPNKEILLRAVHCAPVLSTGARYKSPCACRSRSRCFKYLKQLDRQTLHV